MKRNMSNLDRIVRALAAVLLGYLYFSGTVSGVLGIILMAITAVLLVTAITGSCLIYTLLKTGTLKG